MPTSVSKRMAYPSDKSCAAATSFDAAQAILRANAIPLRIEQVALSRAGQRILAEPIVARINSPRRDCAAMDGFAIRFDDVAAGRKRFRRVGSSAAGGNYMAQIAPGTAVAVSTGAPMPSGADLVVMQEHVRITGEIVEILSLSGKLHVRNCASDFAAGDSLLAPSSLLGPRALVVAGAADIGEVTVWRQPRLHLVCNGDELAPPGNANDRPWMIPDSLTEGLLQMARQWGATPVGVDCVRDDAAAITAAVQSILSEGCLLLWDWNRALPAWR